MKKLCLAFLFFVSLGADKAVAFDSFQYMYKMSCLPEVKEFRADVYEFLGDSDDWVWRSKAKRQGLTKLNISTREDKPAEREESCVIDGVTYKMKFRYFKYREYSFAYKTSVQLYADDKYLGILFPFSSEVDSIYDSVGIKNGKIFVHGCAFEMVDRSDCKYDYKELEISDKTSYELALIDEEHIVVPKFNVVELNCYDGLGQAYVDLRSYNEGSVLPENYYWLKDNPLLKCGGVTMKFSADGTVNVRENKKLFCEFNLEDERKQIFQITFFPERGADFEVEYFDKKKHYWHSVRCFGRDGCKRLKLEPEEVTY